MCGDDRGKVGEKQFRGNLSHEEGAECRILFYCCIVFNLESAAFACSTAVFFFFSSCVSFSGISQYVKQWKIELCTTQVETGLDTSFLQWVCVFSLAEAVLTHLREKAVSAKVEQRRDNQL